MPIEPDKSYRRIWSLQDEFEHGEAIRRGDLDQEQDDIAAALDEVSRRLVVIEAGYFYPSGNLILNPQFRVNTNGYAGGALPLRDYGHNRWRSQADGTIYSVADETCTITVGALGQRIDGRSIVTAPYTITWEGTAACTVDGAPVAKAQTLFLDGGQDCIVQWTAGTLSYPQISIGAAPLPFRARPYEEELSLCRQYIFVEREAAIPSTFIHDSIGYVFAWEFSENVAGRFRLFRRRSVQPAISPHYQSADGAWWEFVPPEAMGDSYEVRLGNLEADILRHEQLFVDAENNLIAYTQSTNLRVSAIETTYATTASLNDQITILASADGALAQRVSSIEAVYETTAGAETKIAAAISDIETAIADETGALASRIGAVEASYVTTGAMTTAIDAKASEITTAYASADTALATRTTALEASVNNGTTGLAATRARVIAEEVARADGDGALASRIEIVEADVGDPATGVAAAHSRITTETLARTTAIEAEASTRQQLSASFGGGSFRDPAFALWGGGSGVSAARWSAQGAVAATDNALFPGGQTLTFTVTAAQADGLEMRSTYGSWRGVKDAPGFVVEMLYDTTGSAALDLHATWRNTAGATYSVTAQSTAVRQGTATNPARAQWVVRRPATFAGTLESLRFYVLINWRAIFPAAPTPAGAGTVTVYRWDARPATAEELASGVVGEAITAAVSAEITARQAAIASEASARTEAINAAVSSIRGGSQSTIAAVESVVATKVGAAEASAQADSRISAALIPGGLIADGIAAAVIAEDLPSLRADISTLQSTTVTTAQAEAISDTRISASLSGGGAIASAIGAKGAVIYSATAPATTAERQPLNMWVDTGGTPPRNRPHRWSGSAWVAISDADIAAAQAEAASKGKIIYATTAPALAADRQPQNMWVDTGGTPPRNDLYRWTGSAWVKVEAAALVSARADISTLQSTKVDASGAIAAVNGEVSAQSGGGLASVRELTSAQTTLDGQARAMRYVAVGANGRVVTQLMGASDDGGIIVFTADRFQIFNGGYNEVPFEVSSGIVRIKSANIGTANINRLNIVGQAVDLDRIAVNTLVQTLAGGAGSYVGDSVNPVAYIDLPYFVSSRGAWTNAGVRFQAGGQGNSSIAPRVTFRVENYWPGGGSTFRTQTFYVPSNIDTNFIYNRIGGEYALSFFGLQGNPGWNTVRLWVMSGTAAPFDWVEMWLTVVQN